MIGCGTSMPVAIDGGDLVAQELVARLAHVIVAVDAGIVEDELEEIAVEAAVLALEARVGGDLLGDLGVGDAELVVHRLVLERRVQEHLVEHLLGADLPAGLLGGVLQLLVPPGEFRRSKPRHCRRCASVPAP